MFLAYILGSQYLCLRPKQKYLPNLFSSHYPNIKTLKDWALVPALRVGLSTELHLAALFIKWVFFFRRCCTLLQRNLVGSFFLLSPHLAVWYIMGPELKKSKNAASKKWIKKKRNTVKGMDSVIQSNTLDYSLPKTGLFYIQCIKLFK